MMFRLFSVLCFSSFFVLLGACAAPEEESTPAAGTIRIEATLDSAVVGSSMLEIEIYNEDNLGVENAAIAAVPYMPMMGHSSDLTAEITEIGDGFYEAAPIGFSMPGTWEVTITVDKTDEYEENERIFSYEIE